MISKHKIKLKDGTIKTNIRIVEGYRPGPGKAPKQRQIKNFGYLEDQENLEKFWAEVYKCEKDLKETKEKINVSLDNLATLKDCKWFSLGEKYIEPIYDFLELDNFFETVKTKTKFGSINISNDAIASVAADAVLQCYGVVGVAKKNSIIAFSLTSEQALLSLVTS